MCIICRERASNHREMSKCGHGTRKGRCKECKGGSICEHNKIRSDCKDCGGGSICEHNQYVNIINIKLDVKFAKEDLFANMTI